MLQKVFSMVPLLGVLSTTVWSQQTSLDPTPTSLCEGVEVNSFVPDPEHCSNFYQCKEDSVIPGSCPSGMFYHSKDVCSFDASDCTLSTEQPGETSSTSASEVTTIAVTGTEMQQSTTVANNDPALLCADVDPNLPHFIKSPTQCSEYYICVDRKAVLQKCGDGKYWNSEQLYCDDRKNVPCDLDRIPNPEEFCSRSQPTEVSFTASPTDCGDYYVCVQRKPFLMRCAPGSHWNDDAKQCDDPTVAGCNVLNNSVDNLDTLCFAGGEAFLGHPQYCNLYIFCQNGKASTQLCPFLTDWDTIAERCVPRHETKCTKPRLR